VLVALDCGRCLRIEVASKSRRVDGFAVLNNDMKEVGGSNFV